MLSCGEIILNYYVLPSYVMKTTFDSLHL